MRKLAWWQAGSVAAAVFLILEPLAFDLLGQLLPVSAKPYDFGGPHLVRASWVAFVPALAIALILARSDRFYSLLILLLVSGPGLLASLLAVL